MDTNLKTNNKYKNTYQKKLYEKNSSTNTLKWKQSLKFVGRSKNVGLEHFVFPAFLGGPGGYKKVREAGR